MKITRNSSGKTNVKNADAGFRQNVLFVYDHLSQEQSDVAHSAPSSPPVSSR